MCVCLAVGKRAGEIIKSIILHKNHFPDRAFGLILSVNCHLMQSRTQGSAGVKIGDPLLLVIHDLLICKQEKERRSACIPFLIAKTTTTGDKRQITSSPFEEVG